MSTTSTLGASSLTRISGLASGLDTDSIVKKMMTGTQSKIDKVKQDKQILEWKQDAYKDIINKLMSFQNKYFSSSSSGSLSAAFYNSKAVSYQNSGDSQYVTVSASATSDLSDISLSNIKVATKSAASTSGTVCQQITLGFDSSSAPIDLTGKSVDLTIDGVTKTLSFSKSYNTAEELSADIKSLADSAFGNDRISAEVTGNNIVINSDGASANVTAASSNDAFGAAGLSLINSKTNRIDVLKSVANNSFATPITGDNIAFAINGQNFSFSKDASVISIINAVNTSSAGVKLSYSSVTDKFSLTSTSTGSTSGITISDQTGNFLSSIIGTLNETNYTQGTDASVYINGTKVTRSQNTFTIDGVTYSLKENTSGTVQAKISTDIDTAVNNIKSFVSDYNDIIDALNAKLNEPKYKDYPPLTDDQKAELKDSEITKWEEKSKSGLLNGDSVLKSILSTLRQSMFTPVSQLSDNTKSLGISLYSIGIATPGYQSKGKLVIDETKLRSALSNNTDNVINLFTQKSDKTYFPTNSSAIKMERYGEEGVMNRLSDILNDSVRTNLSGGSLLQIAGYTGTTTEMNNSLTKAITKDETNLDKLQDDYLSEQKRYYQQFTTMEQYISQMNQQISYLSNNLSQG